jgi:hypothetical protein
LGDSQASAFYMPPVRNPLFHFHRRFKQEDSSCLHRLCNCNRHSVPKRRHIKFRRRGITQKKEYNIQNTAKVWNQELLVFVMQTVDGMLTNLCLEFMNVKSGGT